MATLRSVIESDINTFFDAEELAESATLNGDTVVVVVIDEGEQEDSRARYKFIIVSVKLADYPSIDFRNDALVLHGNTWKYPKQIFTDDLIVEVEFRRDERPLMRR